MKRALLIPLALFAALLWPLITSPNRITAQEAAPPAEAPPAGEDIEGAKVLTRGPIHEAYAEPVTEPKPTMIVAKKPPADVEEVPPEFAPDKEGAIWIDGYWAWDDERDDYIWISGVQRVPPPGMRWVAGYWSEVAGGWQWTPGFWAGAEAEELSYRPAPPDSLEEGPSSPSPGDDYFYVPGTWVYENDYRWSPGYWAVQRPNWVWVPARWIWTPRGCIYRPGRWDFLYSQRGCLYAPVYFSGPIYTRPGFRYRPWCALNVGNLFVHFWVRPNYCHYYFGNYYGVSDRWGLTPWYRYGGIGRGFRYDPMLSWYNCHYRRQGINYTDRISGWHRYYERHENDRPPRTWADQRRLATQVNITNITQINKVKSVAVKQNFLAAKVDDLAKVENSPVRLHKLNDVQRRTMEERAKEVRRETSLVRDQRRKIERDLAVADLPGRRGPDLDGKGPRPPDADKGTKGGAEAQVDARAKFKLPVSKIAVEQPRVTLPERPDRGRATDIGQRGSQGDRSAGRTEGAARVRGAKSGGIPDAAGAVEPRNEPGDRSANDPGAKGTKTKTPRTLPGRGDLPGAEPRTDSPPRTRAKVEAPDTGSRLDRGPRNPTGSPREGAPRSDRSKGAGRRESERPVIDPTPRGAAREQPAPRIETPATDRAPRIERPAPRPQRPQVDLPKADLPKVERGRIEPRVDRSPGGARVDRPASLPRAERVPAASQPRVERPLPRIERPAPRVESPRPAPRVERSAPRVERPAPRIERPSSAPLPGRSSRYRDRD